MNKMLFIRKFKIQIFFLLGFVIGLIVFIFQTGELAVDGVLWRPTSENESTSKIRWGIYDYYDLHDDSDKFLMQHEYFSWDEEGYQGVVEVVDKTKANGRDLYLTIEPFSSKRHNADTLLEDTVDGDYDENIDRVCGFLGENRGREFQVAWGHEMENVTGRYPWAVEDADLYIEGYQYFVERCKQEADNISYVWAPSGNENLKLYWPGEDYVDIIGLSIYSFPELELAEKGWLLTFDELLKPEYDSVKGFLKPIMISELGVTGEEERKVEWFDDAVTSMEAYESLEWVYLFNANDSPNAWPEEYEVPEWYINDEMYKDIPRYEAD